MTDWVSIGTKVRDILEQTFDGIASISITYISADSVSYSLKGIMAEPTNNYQKELLKVDTAGILDADIQRILFKTKDVEDVVGSAFTAAGYITVDSQRYDFATTQPFKAVNFTPWIGAEQTYTMCFVRRAIETAHTETQKSTGSAFQYGGWSS